MSAFDLARLAAQLRAYGKLQRWIEFGRALLNEQPEDTDHHSRERAFECSQMPDEIERGRQARCP